MDEEDEEEKELKGKHHHEIKIEKKDNTMKLWNRRPFMIWKIIYMLNN